MHPNKDSSSDSSSSSSSTSDEDKRNLKKKVSRKVQDSPQKKNTCRENSKRLHRKAETQGLRSGNDIRNFVIKTLNEKGIGANFLIDHNEMEFLEKIGEGGYGEVFLGKWLGQEVAIKQYGKNYSKLAHLVKRKFLDFIKEVEVISNLRHPNIVLYMGVCVDNYRYLMVTEYLPGGSLFDLLHKKSVKLTEDKILLLIEDIALGMNYLHGRKVFHCDLKSSNILIDSNWNIKLCDFGLSHVKSRLEKRIGRVGTPHWMAPEILRGEKYDEYSDVYSYGMVLWEIATGEIPYMGWSRTQIVGAVGYDSYQLPLPRSGNSLLLRIIEKCLHRIREKRPNFRTIVEWLQANNHENQGQKYVIKELKNFFDI